MRLSENAQCFVGPFLLITLNYYDFFIRRLNSYELNELFDSVNFRIISTVKRLVIDLCLPFDRFLFMNTLFLSL